LDTKKKKGKNANQKRGGKKKKNQTPKFKFNRTCERTLKNKKEKGLRSWKAKKQHNPKKTRGFLGEQGEKAQTLKKKTRAPKDLGKCAPGTDRGPLQIRQHRRQKGKLVKCWGYRHSKEKKLK